MSHGDVLKTTAFGRPVIEVDRLCKRFHKRTVLDELSFSVRKGETVVILGRSGTGKSVTLKCIVGLLEPSAGRVHVLGENIHRLSERERLPFRRDIGYVFQDAALFDSLNVLENVGFPLYQRGLPDEQVADLVRRRLDMVGLGHTLKLLPSELSGGMRKRVGLARAIIDLPPIVLYDEPTSGLDPLTTDVINQIILRLRAQLSVTSVVVTHDMGSAFTIADRIIMLDQGRIVIDGTPDEIRASDNPWVQHFIAGQALEHERIDTARFALPSGFHGGLSPTQRILPVQRGDSEASQAVPPSIRLRRPTSPRQPTLGSQSGRMKAVSPRSPPPDDDSGLHPIDWAQIEEEEDHS